MKHSLTGKITAIMISLVAGTVLLCWFLNTTLLEGYYTLKKQNSLRAAYELVDDVAKSGALYDNDKYIELEKTSEKENIAMIIMDSGNVIRYSLGSDGDALIRQFWEIITNITRMEGEMIEEVVGKYRIVKVKDERLKTEYLYLIGNLADNNYIVMRTALESIRESAVISNRFLTYVGMLGIVVSAIVIFLVTRRITNPILQLVDISKRMTNLDFEAKFVSKKENEIDILGEHMNLLSETLERTISELKSANNELLLDIKNKNEIDEMRKEFLSNVSHELKTPLALIQGYAEGLQVSVNEEEGSKEFYCEVIIDEAGKMNQMVKKLLTLNQLEFGKESVTMERFELTELIRGVINATSILREQNQIELEYEDKGPMYVWADEFKTEEVLTNYLSNAIHHAAGEKKIVITTKEKEGVIRTCVFNTGSQIPEEEIESIWIKFYKVDKARTREYGGNGIGLSIVKAIMDSFHKECGVINKENGVEFWFELDSENCVATRKK